MGNKEYMESCRVFQLLQRILKEIKPEVVDHGYRVAFITISMLYIRGDLEVYELADIAVLATLHDIGAYKTDLNRDMLEYEIKNTNPHAIYGYLCFRYLSPQQERASALLLHHMDHDKISPDLHKDVKILAECLHLAELVDLYYTTMGDKFDKKMFEKYNGSKLSEEALKLFYLADKKHHVLEKLKDGTYVAAMDRLLEYMIFSEEEKKRYREMMIYSMGLINRNVAIDTITRICVSQAIATRMLLSTHQKESLTTAALLCDLGMLKINHDLVEAPRKLTLAEKQELHRHIPFSEAAIQDLVDEDVIALIDSHHERGDGSGYPKRTKDMQMSDSQRILQVADVVSALLNDRPWRQKKEKAEILELLEHEKQAGRFNRGVVDTLVTYYDDIYQETSEEQERILALYHKLMVNYKAVEAGFAKKEGDVSVIE